MVGDAAGVLLSVFFQLLLEVVEEDGKTTCSASGWSNGRDGLVAGWPKTSRRGKQEWWRCRARKQARLGNGNTAGGFPFLYLNGNATVIPTD
jgi:hypothetical protein